MTLPREVIEAIDDLREEAHAKGREGFGQYHAGVYEKRAALESAILAWGEWVREGALREVAKALRKTSFAERYMVAKWIDGWREAFPDSRPEPAPEPAGTPLGERDVSLCECGARLRGDVARSTGTCGACRPSPRSETTEDR